MATLLLTELEETSIRTVANGKAITVTTRVIVAEPSELTWEEVYDLVQQGAKETADGEWALDNHPIFGTFSGTASLEDLTSDVAHWLNAHGVSVSTATGIYALGQGLI